MKYKFLKNCLCFFLFCYPYSILSFGIHVCYLDLLKHWDGSCGQKEIKEERKNGKVKQLLSEAFFLSFVYFLRICVHYRIVIFMEILFELYFLKERKSTKIKLIWFSFSQVKFFKIPLALIKLWKEKSNKKIPLNFFHHVTIFVFSPLSI